MYQVLQKVNGKLYVAERRGQTEWSDLEETRAVAARLQTPTYPTRVVHSGTRKVVR